MKPTQKIKTMKKFRSSCPISRSLDLFGDKWTLLVLRDIVTYGKSTYKDLVAMPEKIATNTLAERLDKLVKEGLLTKERSEKNKLVFNYEITEKGREIIPIIDAMTDWSIQHQFTKEELPQIAG